MSNDWENSDLWKAETFSEELTKLTNENFFNPDLSETKTREIMKDLKGIVADESLLTEDLTSALSYLGDMVAMHPDKTTAKEAVAILNMAIEHPNGGFTSGTNRNPDDPGFGYYYEIDSDVEARKVARIILQQQPAMDNEILNIYEKLAAKDLPSYGDLAQIAGEHSKAIDLFEKIYNKDNRTGHFYEAGYAMDELMQNNPKAVFAVERMVKKHVMSRQSRCASEKEDDKEFINQEIGTKEKIAQLKARVTKEATKPSKPLKSIDRLEQKMHFIEKRVEMFKERDIGGNTDDFRKIEDNIRLTAYKEFTQNR
ncbi:MAG: hypothetical protein IJ099_07340 [Alphaproteobacteria bacterium]|nr:hypothetical protein [Alphaproteobacteria bacterium]